MVRFSSRRWVGTVAFFAVLTVLRIQGAGAADSDQTVSRMNCGAQIECVTPDGHLGRISRLPVQDPTATALIMEDDTVTCLLQEGETNFSQLLELWPLQERFGRERGPRDDTPVIAMGELGTG